MKLNRLEAHDRLLQFKKDQSINIFHGAEDCLKRNPLSLALQERSPYIYLFAHPRTADDGVTKVMYWQPRLSKPEAQVNSYLFRAVSRSDIVQVCWLLPPQEMWAQYEKGKVTSDETVQWSINHFKTNKLELEKPDPQDFSEEAGKEILRKVIEDHIQELRSTKLWKSYE
jgi:hypothetical protein